jgi:hypothetical protein
MALIVSVPLYDPGEPPKMGLPSRASGQPTTEMVVEASGSGIAADPSTGATGSGASSVPSDSTGQAPKIPSDITVKDDPATAREPRVEVRTEAVHGDDRAVPAATPLPASSRPD